MPLTISSFTRRAVGLALTTTLLAATVAGSVSATSPAGDTLDVDFSFRDDPGIAVLAWYPESENASKLKAFRIKGPRVSWIESHPLASGSVGWRVIVQTSSSKSGPWTTAFRTGRRVISANKVGPLEQFELRTVHADVSRKWVRVTSRLSFINEDGGRISWITHTYTTYAIAEQSGSTPGFGDAIGQRLDAVPNVLVN